MSANLGNRPLKKSNFLNYFLSERIAGSSTELSGGQFRFRFPKNFEAVMLRSIYGESKIRKFIHARRPRLLHARRMGAARRQLARLAAQYQRLAGQI
jgi:hypothetical protein